MASGVQLTHITVNSVVDNETNLEVGLVIKGDDEFEAIAWLVGELGKSV